MPRKLKAHAAFILQKLEACRQQDYDQKQVAAIRHKEGIYLEFSGAAGYDLLTKSFDNYSSGIRLLNVREDGQDDEKLLGPLFMFLQKKQHISLIKSNRIQSR